MIQLALLSSVTNTAPEIHACRCFGFVSFFVHMSNRERLIESIGSKMEKRFVWGGIYVDKSNVISKTKVNLKSEYHIKNL